MDLTGARFGRLTVLERGPNGGRLTRWHCLCDCGERRLLYSSNLRSGYTKSCGCIWREAITTHQGTGSRLYGIWSHMRGRCGNPNNDSYHHYGGRGIRVCEEWGRFPAFQMWAKAAGYADGLTIERRDNDGNYDPGNCCWVTQKEQCQNTRRSLRNRYGAELVDRVKLMVTQGVLPAEIERITGFPKGKACDLRRRMAERTP